MYSIDRAKYAPRYGVGLYVGRREAHAEQRLGELASERTIDVRAAAKEAERVANLRAEVNRAAEAPPEAFIYEDRIFQRWHVSCSYKYAYDSWDEDNPDVTVTLPGQGGPGTYPGDGEFDELRNAGATCQELDASIGQQPAAASSSQK